jgi:predicted RNA methylase
VQAVAREVYPNTIARHDRWIKHYENRLAYERAMLGESGGVATDQKKPEKGGACKCWASRHGGWSYIVKVNKVSVSVLDNWGNGGNNFTRIIPFDAIRDIKTAAEVHEYSDTEQLIEFGDKTGFVLRGTPAEPRTPEEPDAKAREFLALKEQAKQGVEVVAVDQLFVTPKELAERVIEAADIQPGQRVLEPSAGTGALLSAALPWNGAGFTGSPAAGETVAVEINQRLADVLRSEYPTTDVRCADFLHCNGDLGKFDRVVMNPPFADKADIEHVTHALKFLKAGGKLVAIMSAGVTFREDRKASDFRALIWGMGGTIEELPEDSFKQSGTSVRTVLVEVCTP